MWSVGNGLRTVPLLLNPLTSVRNAAEGVPYRKGETVQTNLKTLDAGQSFETPICFASSPNTNVTIRRILSERRTTRRIHVHGAARKLFAG